MIDEKIREALDVDPSPDFLARVRTRIATEPAPSPWRRSWTIAAAGAMAAALVVAVIVSRPAPPIERRSGPAGPGTTVANSWRAEAEGPALQAEAQPATQVTQASASPSAKAFALQIPAPAIVRRPIPTEPEILLDPAETRALRALIAGVRDGRVDLTAVRNSVTPQPMALEPVTDIVIAPISIDPLAPPSGAEGVRP